MPPDLAGIRSAVQRAVALPSVSRSPATRARPRWRAPVLALLLPGLLALFAAPTRAGEPSAQAAARLAELHPVANARSGRTDPAALVAPAEQLLLQESAMLGEVRVQVSPPDNRLDLAACEQLEAFLPPGARAQGHTTVGVRCLQPSRWTVYLQAQVQVLGAYLVAAHPLAAGQLLAATDVVTRTGDLGELPGGMLSDADAVTGRTLAMPLNTGQALRREVLKVQAVVLSGQAVRLHVAGRGFEVSGEGVAVAAAGDGQPVQVRTPRGSVVSGIARPGGVVELHL